MLIYLADLAHDHIQTVQYTPTGIGYLAAYLKGKFGDEVEVRLFKSVGRLLDAFDESRPDLVGLSNYTWSAGLTAFAGRYVKEQAPDLPIVMGGPNIRTDEKGIEAFLRKNEFVDSYCMYAGEFTLYQIVEFFRSLPPGERTAPSVRAKVIDGAYSLHDGALSGNARYFIPNDLDEIPSPFLGGFLDEFLDRGFIPIFETNRGCPFTCTFCVWGISALGKLRKFSVDRVKQELTYVVRSKHSVPILCFGDANFGILPRDVQIAKHVRELYDETHSFSSVQFYWSKTAQPHLIEIGRVLGHLTQTYIAFQSLDPVVLENIRRKNISTDDLVYMIRELKAFTDSTQTDILVGLPGETYQSHLASLESALGYGIDTIHGGEVRMLPGAEMDTEADRQKYGLRTKWRLFEGGVGVYRGRFVYELEEVIRATNAMTEAQMLQLRLVRALFYASVSLGEHRPLVRFLKSRDLAVTEMCARILERGRTDPVFARALDWLQQRSLEEWFETPADAARFVSDESSQQALISDTAYVKLNTGFLSKLYLEPELYDGYYRVVEQVLLEMCPADDPVVVRELVSLCRQRNYLVRCLRGDSSETAVRLRLDRRTVEALIAAGYVSATDAARATGMLALHINETTAGLCREFVQRNRGSMTILKLAQMLTVQPGRFMMRPEVAATTVAVVAPIVSQPVSL